MESPRNAASFAENLDGIAAATEKAYETGQLNSFTDDDVARLMRIAVRLYAARVEAQEREQGLPSNLVTATEAVTVACALIRSADINLVDLTMWYNRAR